LEVLINSNSKFKVSEGNLWVALRGRSRLTLESLTCDIKRANDSASTAIENMGVDHGGFDIFMAKEFLDGADVVAIFQ